MECQNSETRPDSYAEVESREVAGVLYYLCLREITPNIPVSPCLYHALCNISFHTNLYVQVTYRFN